MIVTPYNPEWPRLFAEIRAVIQRNIPGKFYAVEHVGSTSIPGMTAKPIIDIVIVVREGQFENVKRRLENLGYVHEGDKGIPGREVFDLRDPALKAALATHHLYVCPPDNDDLHRVRAFREYLIAHPDQAERLSAHKRDLAERFGDDRYAYQEAKGPMVEELVAKALAWLEQQKAANP